MAEKRVSYEPRFHGGAPGMSLNPVVGSTSHKPADPRHPAARVLPTMTNPAGVGDRRMLGSSRERMVSAPAIRRYEVKGKAATRGNFGEQIARGVDAKPKDDFQVGGPVSGRGRCADGNCGGYAPAARPSRKRDGSAKERLIPVGRDRRIRKTEADLDKAYASSSADGVSGLGAVKGIFRAAGNLVGNLFGRFTRKQAAAPSGAAEQVNTGKTIRERIDAKRRELMKLNADDRRAKIQGYLQCAQGCRGGSK